MCQSESCIRLYVVFFSLVEYLNDTFKLFINAIAWAHFNFFYRKAMSAISTPELRTTRKVQTFLV